MPGSPPLPFPHVLSTPPARPHPACLLLACVVPASAGRRGDVRTLLCRHCIDRQEEQSERAQCCGLPNGGGGLMQEGPAHWPQPCSLLHSHVAVLPVACLAGGHSRLAQASLVPAALFHLEQASTLRCSPPPASPRAQQRARAATNRALEPCIWCQERTLKGAVRSAAATAARRSPRPLGLTLALIPLLAPPAQAPVGR